MQLQKKKNQFNQCNVHILGLSFGNATSVDGHCMITQDQTWSYPSFLAYTFHVHSVKHGAVMHLVRERERKGRKI